MVLKKLLKHQKGQLVGRNCGFQCYVIVLSSMTIGRAFLVVSLRRVMECSPVDLHGVGTAGHSNGTSPLVEASFWCMASLWFSREVQKSFWMEEQQQRGRMGKLKSEAQWYLVPAVPAIYKTLQLFSFNHYTEPQSLYFVTGQILNIYKSINIKGI